MMVKGTPTVLVALFAASGFVHALPVEDASKHGTEDPFAVIDPQKWENPDDMTWDDYIRPPGSLWFDSSRKGYDRNFNIALVAVDYPDQKFVITMPANSTVFTNPQPAANSLDRKDVPAFYRDLLNKPQDLNRNHTLHEYWMEDSGGRFGVDLTAFGAYRMPSRSYQYGVDDEEGGFNEDACPSPGPCSVDLRTDALGAWRADVGNETADAYELVFILSAGQDESSTWQEFGEMLFDGPDDVPEGFGPPDDSDLPNWAHTRYVNWTSWASAASIWPNAGGGSSTQGESSGMATYAHELTHLLGIGDNYNNPFSKPPVRSYTGPWSMLSRGSFNGPGGPHTRWQIPSLQGGSLGSPHTMGDKMRIGLVNNASVLKVSQDELSKHGVLVADLTARVIHPNGTGLMGVHIMMGKDLSPACNQTLEPLCDGGDYNNYDLEVIDRMGSDSFQPDHGVMISKTKDQDNAPFQWVIDANPQDIRLIDYYRSDGSPQYITIGDYRQLADALFHAGTRSGSEYEYVDKANKLHFYILNLARDDQGILQYTVGVRSLDAVQDGTDYTISLSDGKLDRGHNQRSEPSDQEFTATCSFKLKNRAHVDSKVPRYMRSDIYRLSAEVQGKGWTAVLPNALAAAESGRSTVVTVAVGADKDAVKHGKVTLTVISESNEEVKVTKECRLSK